MNKKILSLLILLITVFCVNSVSGIDETAPIELRGEFNDYGLDEDNNGLYDYLVIEVGFRINKAGEYDIDVRLDVDGARDDFEGYLEEGEHSIQFRLPGAAIYLHATDGPYELEDIDVEFEDDEFSFYNAYVTSLDYSYLNFERPNAAFTDEISDYGLDEDENGFYDYLVVEIGINVTKAGDYWIYAAGLEESSGDKIEYHGADTTNYFDVGEHTVQLKYNGPKIRVSRTDGPYFVEYIKLNDRTYRVNIDEIQNYETSAYSYTDFEKPYVSLTEEYSDYGVDTNGNELYNSLIVEVGVDVIKAGIYNIRGDLEKEPNDFYLSSDEWVYLEEGTQTVQLEFSGLAIYSSEIDGPYILSYIDIRDSNYDTLDNQWDAHVTAAYNYEDFEHVEEGPPINITKVSINGDDVTNFGDFKYDIERNTEMEIEVHLFARESRENIKVEAFLLDTALETETDIFDANAGTNYVKNLNLYIPPDFEPGDYQLKILVSNRDGILLTKSINLVIGLQRHDLQIYDIILTPEESVKAGRALLATVVLRNFGEVDEPAAKVRVNIPELGISASDYVFDIESGDIVDSEELYMRIPDCAEPDNYEIKVELFVEDELIDTDYDEIEVIEGDVVCPNHPPEIIWVRGIPEDIRVGDTVRFEVGASDPDNDDLTFKWYVDGEEAESYTPLIEEDIGDYRFIKSFAMVGRVPNMYGALYNKDLKERGIIVTYLDFPDKWELQKYLHEVKYEYKIIEHNGYKLGLLENGKVILFWTYENDLILFGVHGVEMLNEVIDVYLEKYPSDLKEMVEEEIEETEIVEEEPEEEPETIEESEEITEEVEEIIETEPAGAPGGGGGRGGAAPAPPEEVEEPIPEEVPVPIIESYFIYHANEAGEHEIKVVVSDGELEAEHNWEINVEKNIEEEMEAEVEEALDSELFSLDNTNICIIIKEDDHYIHHSFDVEIADGVKEVSISEDRYCDGFENEDFVFSFINYQSFLQQKQDLGLNSLIENGGGKRFYVLPSKFVKEGGGIVVNEEFEEKYCPVVRENLDGASMLLYGLSDCRINRPPTIDAYQPAESKILITEDGSQTFSITKSDHENDELTVNWYIEANPVSTTDSYTYVGDGSVGEYNVKVVVSDGELTAEHEWILVTTDVPIAETFDGSTTNFSQIPDSSQATNIILEKTQYGKINFGDEILDLSDVVDLDSNVIVGNNIIGINTDKLPALNHPATIIMYNLPYSETPIIYYNQEFTLNPNEITGVCPDDICSNISYSSGTLTFNVAHFSVFTAGQGNKLTITDLDVRVDDNKDSNLKDGDKISDEAKGDSKVEFEIKVENLYKDIEIENIKVNIEIENIDDGDNLEEESKEFDLEGGENKIITLDFSLPSKLEEGTYDVKINVEGEDTNHISHKLLWTLYLEVEQEKHDVRISEAEVSQTTLSCGDTANLNLEIVNMGRTNEDILLKITNRDLKLNIEEEIKLKKGESFDKSYNINVPEGLSEKDYPISIYAYYNKNKLEDTQKVNLNIRDCKKRIVEDKPKEAANVVDKQVVSKISIVPQEEDKISIKEESKVYLLMLLIANVGLLVIVSYFGSEVYRRYF